jgi:hypothetical protein
MSAVNKLFSWLGYVPSSQLHEERTKFGDYLGRITNHHDRRIRELHERIAELQLHLYDRKELHSFRKLVLMETALTPTPPAFLATETRTEQTNRDKLFDKPEFRASEKP